MLVYFVVVLIKKAQADFVHVFVVRTRTSDSAYKHYLCQLLPTLDEAVLGQLSHTHSQAFLTQLKRRSIVVVNVKSRLTW